MTAVWVTHIVKRQMKCFLLEYSRLNQLYESTEHCAPELPHTLRYAPDHITSHCSVDIVVLSSSNASAVFYTVLICPKCMHITASTVWNILRGSNKRG